MTTMILRLFPVFLFATLSFAEETPNVKELLPGFYVGQGMSPAGEKIYFGMEKITPANKEGLDDFSRYTERFFGPTRGIITTTLYFCSEGEKNQSTFEEFDGLKNLVGFSKPEFETFYKQLCDKSVDLKARHKRLLGIPTGPGFMFHDIGDYVAYVSKTPITEPITWKTNTVKDYLGTTKNLIMTVGVTLDVKVLPDAFQNRGIARTYFAILNGGYKNVSLPLHGFTAAVAKKFLNKKTFLVQSAPLMTEAIKKELKPDEYKNFKANQPKDTGFIIPVETLISIYTGARKLKPAND